MDSIIGGLSNLRVDTVLSAVDKCVGWVCTGPPPSSSSFIRGRSCGFMRVQKAIEEALLYK